MAELSVEYLGGSGFLIRMGEDGLLFDCSENGADERKIPDEETLSSFENLTVFVSHAHEDHFSPEVLKICPPQTRFIFGFDVPEEYAGKHMHPGDVYETGRLKVTAFDSTDDGVSFLVETDGVILFHAGDLNWWHWRDTSTIAEIEESEANFRKCVDPIPSETIDLAFFPVDPRQGSMYDAGAGYFVMEKKPRILIPMHFQGKPDAARRFALTSETVNTRIEVLSKAGEQMILQL